jgi:hypothetical protein
MCLFFYAPERPSLHLTNNLLLISNKFWMGGGGGRSEWAELEGENRKGGGGE